MGKNNTRKYTLEFKKQAVQLSNEIGNRRAAQQLGIPEGNLYTWKKDEKVVGSISNTANKLVSADEKESPEAELKRLRKEVIELKKVNHILKAVGYFCPYF